MIEVRPTEAADHDAWIAMRRQLFSMTTDEAHRRELRGMASRPDLWATHVAVVGGRAIGFIETSLREHDDTVERRRQGHVEAWFVLPEFREQGVGRAMLDAATAWSRARGADVLGSDAGVDDLASRSAHGACGFHEREPAIVFERPVEPPPERRPAADVLETERLVLRQLRQDDFEDYHAIFSDEAVYRHLSAGLADRSQCWRSLAVMVGEWRLLGFGMYAVVEKSSGRLVGQVGFHEPEGWPDMEIGWTLGRAWWGKGYATEAAAACRDHAFGPMGRDRFVSLIAPDNAASKRVAERLGEERVGDWSVLGHDCELWAGRRPAGR